MISSPTSPLFSNEGRAKIILDAFMCCPQARHDPAWFVANCLRDGGGFHIEPAEVHRDLQEFLTGHTRALVELPRDHGKSTQLCGRILWELGRNPSLRVKIVCATDEVAWERSRFLRDAIRDNAFVRTTFPHLVPAEPWTAWAFSVRRPGDAIGPSVAAFGVGATHTGTRADLLVCDDVVDVRSLHSRAVRERVIDYFHNNLMNLLEPDGRFWGLFTPWHGDDLNARLKKNAAYALFRRAVGGEFESIWPEKWPVEKLRARREEIGDAAFSRGYRLLPVSETETPIRPEWVRYWNVGQVSNLPEPRQVKNLPHEEYDQVILAVDPAVSTKARADRSALVVLGKVGSEVAGWRGGENQIASTTSPPHHLTTQIHVLAATARRVAAPELVELIDALDRQWNPMLILFESNAAFAGMKDLLARQTRFGPKLKGVTQTADKSARIAAFSVAVENGAFRLRGAEGGGVGVDESQRALYEEMIAFPYGAHDDLLDAAATGAAYLLTQREPMAW